ncbi:MAG: helix-turn-helix domain-containing protein [Lachnospiraceae bacterium]|nr:helix-turn-helix domain-containing protein [Lachnospiraceae bacterium]
MAESAAVAQIGQLLFFYTSFMNRELFETMPDMMDAKQLAAVLHLSKSGTYNLLNSDDFLILKIGDRKQVMKQDLLAWLKQHTNGQEP